MKAPLLLWAGIALAGAGLLSAQPPAEVRLAEFATSLKGRTRNQRHNATLAMEKLACVPIGPGETFSFNETVGTYTVDVGYRKAPVSYNGQLLEGFGGGVCQTSTTLYNAALLAGLEIVERSRHRFAPLYAPPGRDAGVAYPNIDLKLRNPFPYPVEIRGRWIGDRLAVGIFAPKRSEPPAQIVTQILDAQAPGTVVLARKSKTARARNSGKSGFDVATYRVIGSRKELISRDAYPSMARVVEYFEGP